MVASAKKERENFPFLFLFVQLELSRNWMRVIFIQSTDSNANLFWKYSQRKKKIMSYQLSGHRLAQSSWYTKVAIMVIVWGSSSQIAGFLAKELFSSISHRTGSLYWILQLCMWWTSMLGYSSHRERQWILLGIYGALRFELINELAPHLWGWPSSHRASLGSCFSEQPW